jgi:DNA-binding IclR family transcriptional regulator
MADDGPVVDAAVTAFDVLDAVHELDRPGVSEVARHIGRSKSGVYKHLTTLRREGYLSRAGDGYDIGLGAWALGRAATDRFPLEEAARTVDSLAASIDHSVTAVFYDDGAVYYTYQNCSPAVADRIGGPGDRLPLHATAAGKAILAYLPEQRREQLLAARPLTRFTQGTVTDPVALAEQAARVREERTATERNERTQGITSVAAPITTPEDAPVGAITVVGTADELDEDDLEGRMLSLVVNAARSVENAIAQR